MVLNVSDLDGRTRAVRRAKALMREFIAALGGSPAPHQLILVRSAAELTALAEQTRAQLLAGDSRVTINDVIRSENAMARAIRALAIPAASQAEDVSIEAQLRARGFQPPAATEAPSDETPTSEPAKAVSEAVA